jgi:hypothetical protein
MTSRPSLGDVITGDHRGQTVTGEVLSVFINGSQTTVTLKLRSPEYVVGETGRRYDRVYMIFEGEESP